MTFKNLGLNTLFLALALLLVGCEVEQTQEGEMPEVDMQTESGQMPEYDVDTADVDVGTEKKQMEVPDVEVETEEKTVTVPDVDVTMPDEKKKELD